MICFRLLSFNLLFVIPLTIIIVIYLIPEFERAKVFVDIVKELHIAHAIIFLGSIIFAYMVKLFNFKKLRKKIDTLDLKIQELENENRRLRNQNRRSK